MPRRCGWGHIGEYGIDSGRTYFDSLARSEAVPPPPGAVVAAKRMVMDPQDEPQWGERIPYVIARGAQGSRLVDRALNPFELLDNPSVEPPPLGSYT